MPRIDPATREITCKLIYEGPERSGKTSSLRYLQGRARTDRRRAPSLAPALDFLPLEIGLVSGFTVRFQVYAVPGGSGSAATRRLVLEGADGLMFVADSQARRFDDNLESLRRLESSLNGRIPLVIQYNKQDLPADLILAPEELAEGFAAAARPGVSADALHGAGVFEAFALLSGLVLEQLR